jgi:subfamily B ATP-binding cassette protein MsbA
VNTIKKILKKYFQYFYYFYAQLGNKIFISFLLSLMVGIMDGFGLAMFIPLLQMVDTSNPNAGNNMGNMSFLPEFFIKMGLPLNLMAVLCIILFFFSIKGILKYFEGYMRAVFEQYFIRKIRMQNIIGLSNFSFNKFINADVGRIQNTFSGEVEKVKQAYRSYFMALQYGVFVLVYISMAFFSNPNFAVMVVIGGATTSLFIQQLKKRTKKLSHKITVDSHEFQGLLIQKVSFFKYLKSTGLIHKYAKKLIDTNDQMHNTQKKLGVLAAILGSVREPIVIFVVLLSIIIEVNYFHQTIGIIIFTLLLFYRALISLTGMQNFFNLFFSNAGSLQNMTAFNQELKEGKETTGTKPFTSFEKEIELKDVSFSYEDHHILSNVNLTIPKNETIAIVGESGSGKTTLINIITGLLKPTTGQMKLDGIDLQEINAPTFQNRIGYITQEAVIFNDTIFNNVSFWDEPTEENMQRFESALKKASIYDFVMKQPMKGNEILGSNGINISGGQKQRISIARELYKEVDFLFMDEATSALDSETEKDIKDNIDSLKGSYTIIIIAHRLSTIKNADRIILLNNGSILAAGPFDQLIEHPVFEKMVQLQGFNNN